MNFKEHYFTEVESTPRKGIRHIYDGEKNSMKPKDFLEIIDFIKKNNNGKLNAANTDISEKSDGMRLFIALNGNDEFFIESSRSGPIKDEGQFRQFTIDKRGETNPIAEGYEDILKTLKNDKKIQQYLKSINTPSGVKVQTEVFYMPTAKTSDKDNSVVKFVATWYKKEKLGDWATFVIINITDGKNRPFPQNKIDEIKGGFKKLSTDRIKFDCGDIKDFGEVDLSQEIQQIEIFINTVEKEYGKKIDDILSSRKQSANEQKRRIKQELLNLQKDFSKKLSTLIKTGKFGDEIEGLVFNIADKINFKIVTDRFKEAKREYNNEKL